MAENKQFVQKARAKRMDHIEHVLHRADTYVGKIKPESKKLYIFNEENKKITYVYDFMNFWIFDIELLEILSEKKPNIIYPHISESIGTAPVQDNIDNDDFDDEDTKLIADLMKYNKWFFDD